MRLFNKCLMLIVLSAFHVAVYAQSDSVSICQSCLCTEDQTPAGVMISHIHEKKQWMISYRFMSMKMGGMVEGRKELSDNDVFQNYLMTSDNMRMNMHMLMAMYGLSNKLTLMGMANFNSNEMKMKMLSGSHHHGGSEGTTDNSKLQSSGFGDIKLSALYGLINSEKNQLLINAGLNIPVGSIKVSGKSGAMYDGMHLPYSMQLGSGTWDISNTISYLHNSNDITWSSQVTSVIRPGMNSLGYKLGDEVTFNNWFAWQWARSFSSSIRLEAQALGKMKGMDKSLYSAYEPAADAFNSGGQRLNTYLGTIVFLRGGFLNGQRLGIEAGIPLYQYLKGIQMKSTYTINASWYVVF